MNLNKKDWEGIERMLKEKDRTEDFEIARSSDSDGTIIKVFVYATKKTQNSEAKK